MSAVMEFRISGQGKSLFGDGIALWLADQAYFSTGTYHGFNEYFKGVGIVIDTYKNRGDKSHKDVSLVVNDGQSDYSEKAEELKGVKDSVTGCMSNVRYHAKAHDFNAPFNTSRVMVNVVGRSINVKVDPRATGDWEECFEVRVENEGLGSDWLARSHVGITASTGDLADNHDIIAFSVYDNQDAAYASLSAVRGAAPGWVDTSSLEGKTKAEKLNALEERVTAFMKKLDVTEHHLEHEMIRLRDYLDHMIDRIDNSEEDMMMKIQHVEELMYMDAELDGWDGYYGGGGGMGGDDDYYRPTQSRQAEILSHFRARLDDTTSSHKMAIEEAIVQVREGATGWRHAYAVVVFVVLLGGYGGYQFFYHSKRHHLI